MMNLSIGSGAEADRDVLGYFRSKGVQFWSNDKGELRFRAPKGALSREDMDKLRASGEVIAKKLSGSVAGKARPPLERRQTGTDAPLTYAQLAHWQAYQLDQRNGIRQVASATHISGSLNVDLLVQSFEALLERHEVLRTRILLDERNVPFQRSVQDEILNWRVVDLASLDDGATRNSVVRALINDTIMDPIQIGTDQLIAVRLAHLCANEYTLIVAMEHTISDAYSMNVLLRDLFAIYDAKVNGVSVRLPELPVQIADYAVWQNKNREFWLGEHGSYWQGRLAGCQRVRFPTTVMSQGGSSEGWGTVPIHIGKAMKDQLQDWCRSRRTTMAMTMLTAYVALVMRWCDVRDCVVRYQTDARTDPQIVNAIGYFASILHLRLEWRSSDTFSDLLIRVRDECCNAHEHADYSFIDAQGPRAEFAHNAGFNWVPRVADNGLNAGAEVGALKVQPMQFEHPMLRKQRRDSEPTLLLYERDATIDGGVHYPLWLFSSGQMERFERNLEWFLQEIMRDEGARVGVVDLIE